VAGTRENVVWTIGAADGRSPDLYDNYKAPLAPGDVVWRVADAPGPDRRWPLFHPSEADPDAGYRLHTYTVEFDLEREPARAYLLRLDYLVIAPRVAFLEIRVNGTTGNAYLRPQPSRSGEIRLQSGLHTAIYAEGAVEVVVPGNLLRRGRNLLELVSRDGGETLRVTNEEAVKRLDRMADGAGFIYQRLQLSEPTGWDGEEPPLRAAELVPTVVYLRNDAGDLTARCHLYLELNGPVEASTCSLELREGDRRETVEMSLPAAAFGHLRLELCVFDGEGEVGYELAGTLGGRPALASGSFLRRRKWKVYIAPHSHADIGYTHRQWEVAERLCRNIDTALGTLETEAGASFSFHLDCSWPLETYLATRSERRRRQLLEQVAAGRVSVAANYADMLTQFAGLEDLIRNGEFTEGLLRPAGLRSKMAAFVDVASLSGSLPAVLQGSGVDYLVHANNQDRGPFRLNGGLDRVSPFWWLGNRGGRVLCWLAKMYCELRKVCGSPPLPAAAERGLDLWLREYESEEYAPDAVLLYGQEADNTDLDPQPNEFVRLWNERHAYPRLIPGDVSEFFGYVEERFGDRLAEVRGDGGAYWEDGALSSLAPTIEARHAQARLPAAERLESLAVIHGRDLEYPAGNYDSAWRELLLFDEHTWGAFLSCTDPEALLAQDQWAVKEHMARGAGEWSKRLLHAAATRHSLSWNNDGREVVVYNPHSWPVSGPVTVEIAAGEQAIDPQTGNEVPTRLLRRSRSQAIVSLWVDELPALGYRRLVLRPGAATPTDPVSAEPELAGQVVLENSWYRLTVETSSGRASGWLDKELGRELVAINVGGDAEWGFGQPLYALGGEGTRLVSNQADLPDGNPRVQAGFRVTRVERRDDAFGRSVLLKGEAPFGELEVEWTLPAGRKRVDVRFRAVKDEVLHKEALYVAFPLAGRRGSVLSDSQLGWVDWRSDQLPGGCKEWLPLQTGILSRGEAGDPDVLIASPDIPMFCVGDIVRGRWPRELDLGGGSILSYVLNNYWHTNYKASQGGEIAFGYSLTSAARISEADAYRAGWESRLPLYGQRMSYQDFREVRAPYQDPSGGVLAEVGPEGVAMSTMKRARWAPGFVVRLQEIAGEERSARLSFPHRRIAAAWRTDLLEREQGPLVVASDGSLSLPVPAWGLATVRIEFEDK
jgi:alpha-mannosidase